MWVQKPGWISHLSEEGEELPILTLDIDPAQERLITGSIDNIINVWQFASLLDGGKDDAILSVLTEHQGPVNCLRWSPAGNCFASASDDSSVLIWELRGQGVRSEEKVAEEWRAVLLLRGHSADVKEVAWSSSGQLLASGSVDNKILIWDVERGSSRPMQCLEGHTGQVTGLAFDPASHFLVSLAQDCAMVVWDLQDWTVKHRSEGVYKKSDSQQLKRLSVSPDGFYIVTPGPKKSTFKYMGSAYTRDRWEVDVCLVGHLQTLSVVKCSPVLYRAQDGGPTWCVAVGSYDCALSVWRMGDQKPLVVRDVFEAAVADIAWSPDGKVVVACSSDGSIATLFLGEEMGKTWSRAETFEHIRRIYGDVPRPGGARPSRCELSNFHTFEMYAQTEVRTESGRRRIRPSLLTPASSAGQQVQETESLVQPMRQEIPIAASALAPPELPPIESLEFIPHFVKSLRSSANCSVENLIPYTALLDTDQPPVIFIQYYPENSYAKSKIRCLAGQSVLWEDLIQYTVKAIAGNWYFTAIHTEEGYLCFYTAAGRKMLPEILIGELLCLEASEGQFVLAVLKNGLVMCWDLAARKIAFKSDISALLTKDTTVKAELSSQGRMIIHLSNNKHLAYNQATNQWVDAYKVDLHPLSDETRARILAMANQTLSLDAPSETGMRGELTVREMETTIERLWNDSCMPECRHLLLTYVDRLEENGDFGRLNRLRYKLERNPEPALLPVARKITRIMSVKRFLSQLESARDSLDPHSIIGSP